MTLNTLYQSQAEIRSHTCAFLSETHPRWKTPSMPSASTAAKLIINGLSRCAKLNKVNNTKLITWCKSTGVSTQLLQSHISRTRALTRSRTYKHLQRSFRRLSLVNKTKIRRNKLRAPQNSWCFRGTTKTPTPSKVQPKDKNWID